MEQKILKNPKISQSIKAKHRIKKILALRIKWRIKKFIEKEFPYVEIAKIKIDFFNLPEKLNKEYKEIKKEVGGEN